MEYDLDMFERRRIIDFLRPKNNLIAVKVEFDVPLAIMPLPVIKGSTIVFIIGELVFDPAIENMHPKGIGRLLLCSFVPGLKAGPQPAIPNNIVFVYTEC